MPTVKIDQLGPCYMYLDPASGRKKTKNPNARSALIVCQPVPPAYVCVAHAWAARASTTEITEEVFRSYAVYRWVLGAVETAGQQFLLYSHIIDEALRRGIRLPLVEGKQYTEDAKDQRINDAITPLWIQGRLCIQSYQLALRDELNDFPRGALKDLLDALAGCISLMPKPTPIRAAHDTRKAVVDYLWKAGATSLQVSQYEKSLLERGTTV